MQKLKRTVPWLLILWYLELFPCVFMAANALRCGQGAGALDVLLPPLLLTLALYSLLFFLFTSIWSDRGNRIAAAVILGFCAAFHVADLFTYLNFGDQMRYAFLCAAVSTNGGEFSGFLKLHLLRWSILIPVLYLACIPAVALPSGRRSFLAACASVFLVPVCLVLIFRPRVPQDADKMPFHMLPGLVDRGLDDMLDMRFNAEDIALANRNLKVRNDDKEAVYVLVLGESHSKRRSSLYGFPRQTEPLLAEKRNKGRLFVFRDVVAPHTMTIYSLAKVLSFEAHDSDFLYYNSPNILDIMKAAGFRTWWIDNQGQLNAPGVSYNAISLRADHLVHTAETLRNRGDGVLLEPFRKILADPAPKKFIVLHLWGSHNDYRSAVPDNWPGFENDKTPGAILECQQEHRETVDDYDRTILYNDYILSTLMDTLEKTGKKGWLFYLSDHGENLFEEDGLSLHSETLPTLATVEIPMFLYLTETCRAQFPPDELERIARAETRPIASENTIYALMHLAGITMENAETDRDFLSDGFLPRPRLTTLSDIPYEKLQQQAGHMRENKP